MRLFFFAFLMLLACNCAVNKTSVLDDIVAVNKEPHKISVILFRGDVDGNTANGIVTAIQTAQSDGTEAVVIEISTPGGEVDAAWRVIKAIEDSSVPVVCVGDLQVASAGFYILQTCHVRLMTPHTTLMLHQPARKGLVPGGGRAEDWENVAQQLRSMHEAMVEHVAKKIKLPKSVIKDKTSGASEWWLNHEEALKIGAVDRVVESTGVAVKECQRKVPSL